MAKAVADTRSPAENAAGYVTDENQIIGFSHMHDSGTGGNPSLGNFPLYVHPGCPFDDFTKCDYAITHRGTDRVPGSVLASPGYFSINLTNSVRAEMTVTEHAVLYRFSFPGTDTVNVTVDDVTKEVPYSPLIVADMIDLSNSRHKGGCQVYPESGRIVGDGQYSPSFGSGFYQAFFCADFRGAKIRNTGTFLSNDAAVEPKYSTFGRGFSSPSGSSGAWIQFERPENDSILARVGVSFISVDQACENAESEIPGFAFQKVEEDAQQVWRNKLSVVQVDSSGVSEELQTTFWSGLYRTLLSPQNYTGENPLWNSTEPYFDS